MYLFANKELKMSPGKLGAQVAHAAVGAYKVSDPDLIREWELGGHYTKLVMQAESTQQLHIIQTYIMERGFDVVPIIDEGRTEIAPHSFTALGVEIVDKDEAHTAATFSTFKTYREDKPPVQSTKRKFW